MPPKDTDNPFVKAAPSGTVPKKLPIAPTIDGEINGYLRKKRLFY